MNRHLGMVCSECKEIISVRDGTGMVELDPTILTKEERDQCVRFSLAHTDHGNGATFCLFDVPGIGQA